MKLIKILMFSFLTMLNVIKGFDYSGMQYIWDMISIDFQHYLDDHKDPLKCKKSQIVMGLR